MCVTPGTSLIRTSDFPVSFWSSPKQRLRTVLSPWFEKRTKSSADPQNVSNRGGALGRGGTLGSGADCPKPVETRGRTTNNFPNQIQNNFFIFFSFFGAHGPFDSNF